MDFEEVAFGHHPPLACGSNHGPCDYGTLTTILRSMVLDYGYTSGGRPCL